MAMREKGGERWRNEHERPSGGPGSHDDISEHGRSSEYGANFRDESMFGGDRSQYGRYGANEHYQGNDAGVPYQANRYGSDQNRGPYGREYGNRMSNSIPDYDSSMYGSGQSYGNRDAMRSWRQSSNHVGQSSYGMRDRGQHEGGHDESMLEKVGRFFGIGPKGYKRSDSRIQEDANDALMDDAFVDATHIEVNVKDSEITLEGYVEDRETKRRAEDVVCKVRGVKDCHNHLKIRPLSQSTIGNTLDDSSTTTNGQGERKDRNRQSSVS
ncbi:MAG: BON domain-containing protein [Myxococcota bacterium]